MPNGIKQIICMYLDIYTHDTDKMRNLQLLIAHLQDILHEDLKWKPIPMKKLLDYRGIKKWYRKSFRVVHPDKSLGRGDSIQLQVLCDFVFRTLHTAWNKWTAQQSL